MNAPRIGLIYGGARCCWDDEAAVLPLLVGCEVVRIGINDVGAVVPELDHWVTVHPEKLGPWGDARRANGYPSDYVRWSFSGLDKGQVDRVLEGWIHGSSGLYAVHVALHGLEVDGAVLLGVPMDATPNAFRNERGWAHFERYRTEWEAVAAEIRPAVRSASGWTRDLLGSPTRDWLVGLDTASGMIVDPAPPPVV